MKYKYLVATPQLPPGAKSPIMDSEMMTEWLNDMASKGWEFMEYAQKGWWIFRKEINKN